MALRRDWIPSPNYSARNSGVRLIVVHTAEGATTYKSLGNFFANPSSGVSSHTGIDDTPGVIGEYVARGNKAWTQANANPYSIATELCAFASWTPNQWQAHPVMLQNCAEWIAEEAAAFGIPIVKLNSAQAQGGVAGVCGHVELGAMGGNHWDPGPNFPWQQVIDMAKGTTPPQPPPEDTIMQVESVKTKNYQWVFQLTSVGDLWRKIRRLNSNQWENANVTASVWPGGKQKYGKSMDVVADDNGVQVFVELDNERVRLYSYGDNTNPPGAQDLP